MLKGYRTLVVNAVLMIIPALAVLSEMIAMPELGAIVPVEYKPHYTVAVVLINLFLRKITTTPVGHKQ